MHRPGTTLIHTFDRAVGAPSWGPALRMTLMICAITVPPLGAVVYIVAIISPYLAAIISVVGSSLGLFVMAQRRNCRRR